jgi:hypothetical protein
MVKDPWDVKQDKCPAPQIVRWWANFFSSIWAFQLSFRLALINSSQVGLPDSFGLEGFEEVGRIGTGKSASVQRLVGHCWRVYRTNGEALLQNCL